MSYSLTLYDAVKSSATAQLGNYTAQFRDWKDRTRAIGGYWTADCDFWQGEYDSLVSFNEAYEMFVNGMQRRVVRSVGSKIMWEGYVSGLTLTRNGRTYQRMHNSLANVVKATYTRFGSDYLYNGSAELTGVYSPTEVGPVGGPTNLWARTTQGGGGGAITVTRTPRSTWATDGEWSYYIDNSAGSASARFRIDGPTVSVAGLTLFILAKVKLVTANAIEVQARIGSTVVFTYTTPAAAGEYTVCQTFEVPDSVADDFCNVRFVDNVGGSLWYVDGVKMGEGGTRCETPWSSNADSIAKYGSVEYNILDAGSTDEAAAARVLRKLRESAWLWPTGPDSDSIETNSIVRDVQRDGLQIEFSGYAFTLGFKNYSQSAGVAGASTHITNLIGASEFITVGKIDTNALSCYVEAAENVRIWDSIEKLISAGDVSGNPWMGGVYAGRVFNYNMRPTTVAYIIKDNRWYTPDRNLVYPALVEPGYVKDEDLPKLLGTSTGDVRDDPSVFWASEIEFDSADEGKVNITYSQERD